MESEREVAQSCPTPSDPMDCSLPGSSVHGIFQARVLEWGAITFSARMGLVPYKKNPGLRSFHFTVCVCALEKAMAPHSSVLAWRIPWTEEPGGLQSMGSLGVGHD